MATLGSRRTSPAGACATVALAAVLGACVGTQPVAGTDTWVLQLAHTKDGDVLTGSEAALVQAIRSGCTVRVAWGGRRRSDPSLTVEHAAILTWVTVRNGTSVSGEIRGLTPNRSVLGEDPASHPTMDRFGGTSAVVEWRAGVATDGTFDAIWFYPHSGEFIERVPQRHPMRWFTDCQGLTTQRLYPPA